MGVSLFASGALARPGCGENCRCHSSRPQETHHAPGNHMSLPTDACYSNPMMPCDLESGREFDIPEFAPGSAGGIPSNILGPANAATGLLTDDSLATDYDPTHMLQERSRCNGRRF